MVRDRPPQPVLGITQNPLPDHRAGPSSSIDLIESGEMFVDPKEVIVLMENPIILNYPVTQLDTFALTLEPKRPHLVISFPLPENQYCRVSPHHPPLRPINFPP
uniref:Uncharacterized protein n=1 Tax=Nelumbo nucifera TaxID=4432 RepID=A0A822YJ51_NELNU|nr:TPA_asm: hypothetical protein HUJ06_011461 [Nelumbo nucifera]